MTKTGSKGVSRANREKNNSGFLAKSSVKAFSQKPAKSPNKAKGAKSAR